MDLEKYIEKELNKLDKLNKHDFVQGQKYALENVLTQLRLHVVGSSNKINYKQGFELAKKYIEETPCDPDIYQTQQDAWNKYKEFIIDNNIYF